jgi:hypothetical protein
MKNEKREPVPGGWVEALRNSSSEEATVGALQSAVRAEIMLMHAVSEAGLDWCIERLEQVRQDSEIPTILDIVMGVQDHGGPSDWKIIVDEE